MTAHRTDYVGVGLKLDCPNGHYVTIISGMGSTALTYQVIWKPQSPSLPLPWPPGPDDTEYGERCPCDVCVGRLVGDTVDEIRTEANKISSTNRVNQDTYQLRYLESARQVIVRSAQLGAYGIIRGRGAKGNASTPLTETYVSPERRVEVRYNDGSFEEVEEVAVWDPVASQPSPTYPDTLAGALAALRGDPPPATS